MIFNILTKSAVALILIQFATIATARDECPEGIIKKIISTKQLQDENEILSIECKKWPEDESRMLFAFAYAPPNYDRSGDDVPFHVGIARMPQVDVLHLYQGVINEDATWKASSEYYFTFDTARYNLAKGVRAFALRERGFREPGAADHGADEKFTLFITSDNLVLKPVLFIPYTQFWYYTLNKKNERIGNYSASLSISVKNTVSNGLRDLLITARQSGSNKVIFKQLLKYDGKEYPTEELQKKIYHWWQE